MINKQYKFLTIIFLSLVTFTIMISFLFIMSDSNTIKIGTKNMTEQRIVAYTLEDVIEAKTDYEVDVITGIDSTSFIHSALLKQDIDMYIEYSSVAFIEIFKQIYEQQTSEEIINYITKKYEEVGLNWYTNLGFENSNEIICSSYCYGNNINTYSELAASGNFSFSAPVYFYERSDGYNLLEDGYDFNASKIKMDNSLIFSAILNDEVDAGLAFSTDAKLARGDYVILEDELRILPEYQAGIVVSEYALDQYPELKTILPMFENYFTTEEIQEYNDKVENTSSTAQDVASEISNEILK